ncbi:unnamed protein product, partial [Mesorhabditis spiculigera]
MLVSALLISSIVATPIGSATDSQLAGIDRQRRDGDTKCPEFRPFVCYVYEALGQDYPAWLKKVGDDSDEDNMKCATCSVEKFKECLGTATFIADIAAAVSYPRCIKTDGLPADQKAVVQADELLDCDKNPFYKELGHESLSVTKLPLCSDVDPNQKFCLSTEGDGKLLTVIIIVVAIVVVVLIVGIAAFMWRRSRREKPEKSKPHTPKKQKKESGDDDDA